ncbi:MAG: ribonuclease III domain-containing protein [Synechococcales bacterium]|nr:ribonuclease III domain-containing protein [Synechococcales bacterium]
MFQPWLGTQINDGQVQQLSPAALAYIGDAVYELYVRVYYLYPPKRLHAQHVQVVQQVRAESQAQHLQVLRPYLKEDELEIVRRGRNATSKPPKRMDLTLYQQATSFETLVGYLYLTNCDRLHELFELLCFEVFPEKV